MDSLNFHSLNFHSLNFHSLKSRLPAIGRMDSIVDETTNGPGHCTLRNAPVHASVLHRHNGALVRVGETNLGQTTTL